MRIRMVKRLAMPGLVAGPGTILNVPQEIAEAAAKQMLQGQYAIMVEEADRKAVVDKRQTAVEEAEETRDEQEGSHAKARRRKGK